MVFEPLISTLSFLTIIPTSKYGFDLRVIARNMYFFPVSGAVIGLIVGIVGFYASTFLPPYISSFVILVTLVLITGLHHIDGLADFADGVMVKTDRDSKRKAMSDPAVGSAGASALIINFIGLFIAILNFDSSSRLFYAIIVSEVIAKYVMVLQATVGESAWTGFSSPFTVEMKNLSKIITSIILTVALVFILQGIAGLLTLGIVIVIGIIIYYVAYRNFSGVSGDVFGASNEISRLASLLILSTITI